MSGCSSSAGGRRWRPGGETRIYARRTPSAPTCERGSRGPRPNVTAPRRNCRRSVRPPTRAGWPTISCPNASGARPAPGDTFLPLRFRRWEHDMTTATMDMAGLREAAGRHLGYTDWQEMTQERVNQFADATDDHQFIHVDPERAKETPFGGTVAHGYLTLSLMAPIMGQLMKVSDAAMGVNYGLDRVRFPAPLPVGTQWRGSASISELSEIQGGLQVTVTCALEVKDSGWPSCVAACLASLS